MLRYPTQTTKKTGIADRSAYPAVRSDFPPTACVVLTREMGLMPEKLHG
jgi:hypothetical protein